MSNNNNPPTPLDKFFQHQWQQDGTPVPQRPVTNVVGGGITFDDDPVNNVTKATVSGGGGGGGQGTTTLSNGINSKVPLNGKVTIRVVGPSADFAIAGITAGDGSGSDPGTPPAPGTLALIINSSGERLTFLPEDPSVTVHGIRIDTLSGAPVKMPARNSCALLLYDGRNGAPDGGRWVLQNMGVIYPTSVKGQDSAIQADGVLLTDAGMTAGSDLVHSPSASFTVEDQGKRVVVELAAGAAPGHGTIVTVVDGQNAHLSFTAGTTTTAQGTSADGHMTAGSKTVTSASANWSSADNYKSVTVPGAGPAGANLVTQFEQIIDAHTGTLVMAAETTVTTAAISFGGPVRMIYATDDTAAVLATLAEADTPKALSAVVELPPGIIMVTGLDVQRSGLTIRGSSIGGQAVTNATRLVLCAPHDYCLAVDQSVQLKLERLWIDGFQLAAKGPINLVPLASTLTVEHVLVSGAVPHTANLINVDGSVEVDNVRILYSSLFQDPELIGTAARARAAVSVTFNSQAFNCHVEHCGIFDCDYGAFNQSGSWNLRHVQIFGQSIGYGLVYYEAAQPFELVDLYTERNDGALGTLVASGGEASVYALVEGNAFAVNGNAVVEVRQCIINGKNPIKYGGKQPLSLVSNRLGGNVILQKATPPVGGPPIGIYRMLAMKTVFTDATAGFTGDLTMVDQIGTDGNLANDVGHGGYGINNRNVSRMGAGLEVAGTFTKSGGEVEHCTVIETISYLASTQFGGSAQLIADWDAAVGVTVDGSNNVSAWVDKTGNNYTWVQATSANRPPYVVPGGGAPPYVSFPWPGSYNSQGLGITGFAGVAGESEPFAILGVAQLLDANGFQLIDIHNNGWGLHTGGGNLEMHGTTLFVGQPFSQAVNHVFDTEWVAGSNQSIISIDGAADTHGTTQTSGTVLIGPNMTLGNAGAGASNWTGRVYRLLFVNENLSATYRHQVQAQLSWLYGVAFGGTATGVTYPADSMVDGSGNVVPDRVIVSKCASGLTVTLPAPTVGRVLTVVDETGLAAASIELLPHGSETINGASSVSMTTPYGAVTVRSPDGIDWIAELPSGPTDVVEPLTSNVTVSGSSLGAIATVSFIAPASGRAAISGGPGPGAAITNVASFVVGIMHNTHGGGLPSTLDSVVPGNISVGVQGTAVPEAIVTGLTPGTQYDAFIVVGLTTSGGTPTYQTTPPLNPTAGGGIRVRAL